MKKLYLLGLIFLFNSCTSDSKTRIIRLGHGLDVTHSVHQAMLKADQYLSEISNGKMKIQIYPNQQLGSERECLELLQIITNWKFRYDKGLWCCNGKFCS